MYQNKEHRLETKNGMEKPKDFATAPDYLMGSMKEEYKKQPCKKRPGKSKLPAKKRRRVVSKKK